MLDDIASLTLTKALSGLSDRQRVSSNNIANIETPDYTAKQVSFEDNLRSAVASGDPASAEFTQKLSTDAPGINGNNVSLDTEVITDEKTQLQFSLLTGGLSAKFGLLETVIKGG